MTKLPKEVTDARKPGYDINPLILGRWSPRAMTGEALSEQELMPLFEAARWAPSSYNNQPWRFVYARRDTPAWKKLFALMGEFNQGWTKEAGALAVVLSKRTFEHNGKPSRTHAFDTGSAWENLALEASSRGLVAHGMEGFDYDRARKDLGVPEDYEIMCMVAIGKRAPASKLPQELQGKEMPSDRKPLKEIVMEGTFRK